MESSGSDLRPYLSVPKWFFFEVYVQNDHWDRSVPDPQLQSRHSPPSHSQLNTMNRMNRSIMTMDEMPKEGKITLLRNELETFVQMLNTNPRELLTKQVLILISPDIMDSDTKNWWNDKGTNSKLKEFLFKREHKVNGMFNNWSCGFLGSRWTDCEINKRSCRIAFYSRKSNANNFMNERVKENHQFILCICQSNTICDVVTIEKSGNIGKLLIWMKDLCCPSKYKMSNEMEFNVIEEKKMITFYEIWLSKKRTDNPYRIDLNDEAASLLYDFVFRDTFITPVDLTNLFNLIYSSNNLDELPDNNFGKNLRNDFKKRGLLIEEEEEKITPEKKTRLSNAVKSAEKQAKQDWQDRVEEKEKIRYRKEQEEKQKEKQKKKNEEQKKRK